MFISLLSQSGDIATWGALAFLICVLIAAEVYVHVRGVKGTLLKIEGDVPSSCGGSAGVSVQVRLKTGNVVKATANPCGLCAGKLSVGNMVTVIRRSDGYVLAVPAISRG